MDRLGSVDLPPYVMWGVWVTAQDAHDALFSPRGMVIAGLGPRVLLQRFKTKKRSVRSRDMIKGMIIRQCQLRHRNQTRPDRKEIWYDITKQHARFDILDQ